MKEKKIILVVDDERSMRKNINDILTKEGFIALEASNGESALAMAKSSLLNAVILDINLPKMDGLQVLKELRKEFTELPVLVFTAFGTSERAIEAMKLGAYDYIEKPFELTEFLMTVRRALQYGDLLGEVRKLRSQVAIDKTIGDEFEITGTSGTMQQVFKLIGRAAPTDATVLIQGESGTGKEMIADAIQRHSLRKDKPFIKVNCGGLTETLLESEIFGHEKGAFTGAALRREGRFEIANGGTIFLDEVNNMSPALQMKLLRVLQHRTFERVGGKETISTDVRIIAATNKDLEQEVKAGKFREDLLYRLNVIHITVPPLRERREDIPILIEHFLKKFKPEQKIVMPMNVMEHLQYYSWPGNVRELENVIQRALVMAKGNVITLDDLPITFRSEEMVNADIVHEGNGSSFKSLMEKFEKSLILKALEKSGGNQTKAAALLKVHRRFLFSKIKRYKILSGKKS
jgi:two-component system response regulator AtoC